MHASISHLTALAGLGLGLAALPLLATSAAAAQDKAAPTPPPLSHFFGFEPARTQVIDRDAGPMATGDFNNDGRPDVAVVNNAKSRIELLLLRDKPMSPEEMERNLKVNALRPSPWYDRQEISLPQRVTAIRAVDVDRDGKLDFIYAGVNPAEIVFLRQADGNTFRVANRQRVRGLAARQPGLHVADVMGDAAPEVVTVAEDRILVMPLSTAGVLGEPRRLGSGQAIAGMVIDDFNGDGMLDITAVVNDEQTPLRMFLQRQDPRTTDKRGMLSAELRFDSPALRDVEPIRFADRTAASLGVIERVSRRVVFSDLVTEQIAPPSAAAPGGEADALAEAVSFPDGASKERSVVTTDLDGDGLTDLLATDAKSNTVVLYRQGTSVGLTDGEPFSAFKQPKAIAVAPPKGYDNAETATVFMLSTEEKAVGVARWNAQTSKLEFPQPLAIRTAGTSPVAIGYVQLDGVGTLAVVVNQRRDHTLELHQPTATKADAAADAPKGDVTVVPLAGVNRPPQSMLAADADQDGLSDLLLFTPGEPMIMIRGAAAADGKGGPGRPSLVLTSEQMPQFGLVQAAGVANTALLDVDGDGKAELLLADKNFVRACRYDAKTGWRVVKQVTITDPGTELTGLAVLTEGGKPVIVASDKGNARLLFIEGDTVTRKLRLTGVSPTGIFTGAFAGDNQPGVLCLTDDAFALVRLAGSRFKLESFAAFRSDAKDRAEHELEAGDVNGDGFTDAVIFDSAEQMCSVLTFSRTRKVQLATEFEVFQSRLFSGGDAREFEPRDASVVDVTSDGKADILMLIHDRIMVYPQMTTPPPPPGAKAVGSAAP